MGVQIGSKFLTLCEHLSFVEKVTKAVPSGALEPFTPLLPENWSEGQVYWHPGPDQYGIAELNGKTPKHWLFYRDSMLLSSDGVTLTARIQTPSVERLWGHRGLPADRALLIAAEDAGKKEYARCLKQPVAVRDVLREFPKEITVPAPADLLDYFASYRKLPSLPWD